VDIREKTWYPIIYMFAITMVLSTILIIFGTFTRQRVQDNERIAFERAVLEAVPEVITGPLLPSEIHKTFSEYVYQPADSTAGAYQVIKDGFLIAFVLPIEGPGFWASIKGVVGIAADKKTVTGISFYEQNETPGLGGEIVKPAFRSQFVGKVLSTTGSPLEIKVPPAPLDEHSVHAITGATQTSTRLDEFLSTQIAAWQQAMQERE
jgi:Na+-transporting NADH:ubiquinone oxidoreductase subunit C